MSGGQLTINQCQLSRPTSCQYCHKLMKGLFFQGKYCILYLHLFHCLFSTYLTFFVSPLIIFIYLIITGGTYITVFVKVTSVRDVRRVCTRSASPSCPSAAARIRPPYRPGRPPCSYPTQVPPYPIPCIKVLCHWIRIHFSLLETFSNKN